MRVPQHAAASWVKNEIIPKEEVHAVAKASKKNQILPETETLPRDFLSDESETEQLR